eukprot:4531359-Prymnesium_polylepis.2
MDHFSLQASWPAAPDSSRGSHSPGPRTPWERAPTTLDSCHDAILGLLTFLLSPRFFTCALLG